MSRLDEEYTVSTRHVGLRTGAFLVALVVAIGAIGYGVYLMTRKEPGYYEIQAYPNEDAPLYRNGISLVYYFEGESDEIRSGINALTDLYSGVLLRSYQLLDTQRGYEGYHNLHDLNEALAGNGRVELEVGAELAPILEDAWGKTREGRGFHLFAGALYQEWENILAQEDISLYDPARDPEAARRLERLAQATAQTGRFDLKVTGNTVEASADAEYLALLKEREYALSIVTTGPLTDAYRLEMIRDILAEKGYTRGYLTTESGLTLSLAGQEEGEYLLYGPENGGERVAALAAGGNSCCSFLHAFPLTGKEFLYHDLGEGRYYHPNVDPFTGEFPGLVLSSCVARYDGDVVEACYENLSLYALTSLQEIQEFPVEAGVLACVLAGEDGVYTNDASRVRLVEK